MIIKIETPFDKLEYEDLQILSVALYAYNKRKYAECYNYDDERTRVDRLEREIKSAIEFKNGG